MKVKYNIIAIIVIFYPDKKHLEILIKNLICQVDKIILVDNTPVGNKCSHNEVIQNFESHMEFIPLNDNFGIAKAQNIGIKRAVELFADFILLSDQDTFFPDDYIQKMVYDINYIDFNETAAIVPLFKDINQAKSSNKGFMLFTLYGWKRFFPEQGLYEVDQAISSGKIINSKLIESIGLMNESLFMDWVDYEWCWRARHRYKIIGNANVTISHLLGDSAVSIGFRDINLRPPIRSYYITRNAIYLALYSTSLDFIHKVTLLIKSTRYVVGFPIFCEPHFKQFIFTMKGVIDGLRAKLGKVSQN